MVENGINAHTFNKLSPTLSRFSMHSNADYATRKRYVHNVYGRLHSAQYNRSKLDGNIEEFSLLIIFIAFYPPCATAGGTTAGKETKKGKRLQNTSHFR